MTALIKLHETPFHCSETGFPPFEKGGPGGFPEVRDIPPAPQIPP
jgi:hypothetical protein